MTRASRPRGRRGVSLLEAMVVVAVTSVLAAVSLAMIKALLDAQRLASRAPAATVATPRLADTLRADVWSAATAAWDADAGELRLGQPGGGVIVYRGSESRVERLTGDANKVATPGGVWPVDPGRVLSCEPADAAAGAPVAITLSGDAGLDRAPPLDVRATVGRDLQLLHE